MRLGEMLIERRLLSPEDLERATTPRTKGLIISSPSNPT